jgi:hypothetical protein
MRRCTTSMMASRVFSVTLLLASVVIVWFLYAVVGYSESHNPQAWYTYNENILSCVLLPVISVLSGRLWYRLPAFFAFGAFLILPLAIFVFDLDLDGRYALFVSRTKTVLAILAFCSAAGLLSSVLGSSTFACFCPRRAPSDHLSRRASE